MIICKKPGFALTISTLLILNIWVPLLGGDFHRAVEDNDISQLTQLINIMPGAINAPDSNSMTPLNLAAQLGRTEAVNLLLESGADFSVGDQDNSVPLHYAALGGHIETMQLLLDGGASIDVQDRNGNTTLIHAIASRNFDAALWLIERGADIEIANRAGDTPLHWAVARQNKELVLHLLDRGANINLRTSEGNTPLGYAALILDTGIAKILIDRGANLEIKDNRERTPLSLTARETGSLEMASLLITAGAQVNTTDISDNTPLMLSAWMGHKAVVNILLDNDADLPTTEDDHRDLLCYAASFGMKKLFDVLVESGASIDFVSANGGSLLHDAACGTSDGIVAKLLEHGMDINQNDLYGRTPLHYAAEWGRDNNVRYLLSKGAEGDARSFSGRTAYNLAVEHERASTAQLLRENGVNMDPMRFPELTGLYMGQEEPGSTPKLFAPDIVSTHNFEHGCITFSPDGREAFWTSSVRPEASGFYDCFIMTSRIENGRWIAPRIAEFSALDTDDDVPFFSPDGERLYFLSRRGPVGIWYVERAGNGWSGPRYIEGGPNENNPYWQISVSDDGSIYTGSGGNIWVSNPANNGYGAPISIGSPIESPKREGHPCIAPDESYLIYHVKEDEGLGGGGLYISFKDREGQWSTPTRLMPAGKSLKGMCPVLSPDGKFLFFNARRQSTNDIYWVEIGSLIAKGKEELTE